MCGICGIVHAEPSRSVDAELLVRMRDRMSHRGPDDDGLFLDGPVGLGFRRLSIVDLAAGHQPMANEDESVWIVFNGEIYNHGELRPDLEAKGHVYRTRADTETIIHLYEEEGTEVVQRLNGMFAFAIWDRSQRRLMLARDRLGIKPLYYAEVDGSLVFASEIKALLAHPGLSPALRRDLLPEFFAFRYVSGEQTLFDGVRSLPPGHVLVWEQGRSRVRRWWDVETEEPRALDEATALRELDELLSESVDLRLMSDVPLGAFCSGGVDSSLTTALAVRQGRSHINTFSVGFEERDFDESRYAALVSDRYETRHHRLEVGGTLFADSLPRMIWYNDEPLNHPNSVQIHHLSALARQHVTVALTGEGADELFAGYPRYLIPLLYRTLRWLPRPARAAVGAAFGALGSHRLDKLGAVLPLEPAQVAILNSSFVAADLVAELLGQSSAATYPYRESLLREGDLFAGGRLDALTRLDLKTYLVSILDRMDKMSMAASLEGRVPFLDHRIVEWSMRLPGHFKVRAHTTKWLVKRLGERYLPREVVHRAKSGFGVPLAEWFRQPAGLGRHLALLGSDDFRRREIADPTVVSRIVDEHGAGRADHSELLWELVNLELWHRIFVERTDPADL